jgi:hypothetical protein
MDTVKKRKISYPHCKSNSDFSVAQLEVLHRVQTDSEVHPISYLMGTGGSFLGR